MFSCGGCGETRPHQWSILSHFSFFHANDVWERECLHSDLTDQGNDDEDIDGPQPMVDSSAVQTWYHSTSGIISQYSPMGWHTCRPCAKKYKSHAKWSRHNLSESHRNRLLDLGIQGMHVVSSDEKSTINRKATRMYKPKAMALRRLQPQSLLISPLTKGPANMPLLQPKLRRWDRHHLNRLALLHSNVDRHRRSNNGGPNEASWQDWVASGRRRPSEKRNSPMKLRRSSASEPARQPSRVRIGRDDSTGAGSVKSPRYTTSRAS